MEKKKAAFIGVGSDGSNVKCDSMDEVYMTWWLKELKDKGYVVDYYKNEASFDLSPGIKAGYSQMSKSKNPKMREYKHSIVSEHSYKWDFTIIWDAKAYGILVFDNLNVNTRTNKSIMIGIPFLEGDERTPLYSMIEVKPPFDFKNMTRIAKINISWVWQKTGMVVSLVVPSGSSDCLFANTFTPKRYLMNDKSTAKRNITKHKVVLIDEYLSNFKLQMPLGFDKL